MLFPQIKTVPIESVKPYPNNAKKHPDRQIELLAKQIAEGFDQPIVVDSEMTIIKGHGRLLASKKLGLKTVPIIVRDDLSSEQVRAARIADNKLAETDWDMDLLAQELDGLDFTNDELEDLGFNEDELLRLLDRDSSSGCDEWLDDESPPDDFYSQKIDSPVYIVTGDCPDTIELYDFSKTEYLLADIRDNHLDDDIARFLSIAAYRHTIFNYQKIAEYYAHSSPQVQNLMEKSALVIIDFQSALENGFVRLTKQMAYLAGNIEDCSDE